MLLGCSSWKGAGLRSPHALGPLCHLSYRMRGLRSPPRSPGFLLACKKCGKATWASGASGGAGLRGGAPVGQAKPRGSPGPRWCQRRVQPRPLQGQHPGSIPLPREHRAGAQCGAMAVAATAPPRPPVPRYNEPLDEGREATPSEPPAEPRDKSDTDLPLTAPVIKMPVYWKHMEYL